MAAIGVDHISEVIAHVVESFKMELEANQVAARKLEDAADELVRRNDALLAARKTRTRKT